MILTFDISPVSKPRMTQSDRWKKRDCVVRYFNFKSLLRLKYPAFKMPEANYRLTFYIPMPPTWSVKKRELMRGKPHQQKPDKDNLEKAFLDAVCDDDSYIWDGRTTKYWWDVGMIQIEY